ncbi:helix-turn-helix domain-containing protein [Streptomyces naphthomycinicus]|uniref:helix-turn-helix domain-containing protein n=1 Tax=Streptomyces naphthomycinicus TaxID=2872625 RepID=UPI001CEC2CB2|nr:helix-turn-helix domain-containing protein [Streptomyces sp. TML10]
MLGRRVHVTGPARLKLGAELKKAYSAGPSIRTLAHDCGRSYGFVHRLNRSRIGWFASKVCPAGSTVQR